jgi:hypothetical protein
MPGSALVPEMRLLLQPETAEFHFTIVAWALCIEVGQTSMLEGKARG